MDYTEMLKQEFLDRKARRPAYSERAFARDLKVSSGYVSLLFRNLRALSPSKGVQIAQRLGWPEEKVRVFVESIQKRALLGATSGARTRNKTPIDFASVELDHFRFIADLHHLGALTLIQSRDVSSEKLIATTFGISAIEAELVVARLIRMGLVSSEKGRIKATKTSVEIKEVSSQAIREFHRQSLRKAEAAIEGQGVDRRNFAALTVSFDPRKMRLAKAFINRCLKTFEKKFGNAEHGEVYQLNTQFFSLIGGSK